MMPQTSAYMSIHYGQEQLSIIQADRGIWLRLGMLVKEAVIFSAILMKGDLKQSQLPACLTLCPSSNISETPSLKEHTQQSVLTHIQQTTEYVAEYSTTGSPALAFEGQQEGTKENLKQGIASVWWREYKECAAWLALYPVKINLLLQGY